MSDTAEDVIERDTEFEEPSSLLSDLSEDEVRELSEMLTYQIDQCIADRGSKPDLWEEWRNAREGVPEEGRTGRFEGASQVVTPIIEILSHNVFGKLKSAFSRDDAFFVYKAISSEVKEEIERCQLYTDYVKLLCQSKIDLNWEKHKSASLYESSSMGTVYMYVNWITDRKKFKQKIGGEYGDVFQEFSGVRINIIPLDNVYFRSSSSDLQSAAFIGIESDYQEYQLKNMANMGVFDPELVAKVLENSSADVSDKRVSESERLEEGLSDQKIIKLFLCYYRYDADKDGYQEDLIFVFHKESGTILSVQYNELGARTIEPIVYMSRLGKIEGRGIAEMARHMQIEADFHHRLRMDSSKFEGMPLFVGKIGSGLKSKETIYPGKIFMTVNGASDLQRLQVGNTYAGSMAAENQAVMYAQKVTAMSDTAGGFADQTLKSRDTFKGQLLRSENSSGINMSIFENTEESMDNVGLYILYYLIRNREAVIEAEKQYARLTPEKISALDKALDIPFSAIPMKLYCTCHIANADETIDVMKQNYMMMYQMLTSFYKEIIPAYMMVYGQQGQQMDPESKAAILKGISGSTKFMEKLMKLYGEEQSFKYLPSTKLADLMLEMKALQDEQMMGLSGLQRQVSGPQGMEAVSVPQGSFEGVTEAPLGNEVSGGVM